MLILKTWEHFCSQSLNPLNLILCKKHWKFIIYMLINMEWALILFSRFHTHPSYLTLVTNTCWCLLKTICYLLHKSWCNSTIVFRNWNKKLHCNESDALFLFMIEKSSADEALLLNRHSIDHPIYGLNFKNIHFSI